ncbi:MAG: uracil-DNA glycosylase [Verrucomicrobia bacterium]|nr:uracil-DNA glycosylase [Verrucomicrobiota bacterium]
MGNKPPTQHSNTPLLHHSLPGINADIVACERCPRLRRWRLRVAREKKREFREWTYWGKPVPGFGDRQARVWIIGLAPAAHGANRTGRMFTGDSSGDWLYRALHRAGFASQPTSRSRDDGMKLRGVYISAVCRCAPPDNKPTPREMENCSGYLWREFETLRSDLRVVVCLGQIAFLNYLKLLASAGAGLPKPRPRFAHGAGFDFGPAWPRLVASYHPSRQNTNTRKLTEAMLDAVCLRVRAIATADEVR